MSRPRPSTSVIFGTKKSLPSARHPNMGIMVKELAESREGVRGKAGDEFVTLDEVKSLLVLLKAEIIKEIGP